jgi:hypothetical protein
VDNGNIENDFRDDESCFLKSILSKIDEEQAVLSNNTKNREFISCIDENENQ